MTDPDTPGRDAAGADRPEGAATPASYEAAIERLEAIIERLDSGRAELRETLELCREGKLMVEFCKGELDAVSGELRRLDLDELVSRLEATPAAAGEGAAGAGPEPGAQA